MHTLRRHGSPQAQAVGVPATLCTIDLCTVGCRALFRVSTLPVPASAGFVISNRLAIFFVCAPVQLISLAVISPLLFYYMILKLLGMTLLGVCVCLVWFCKLQCWSYIGG